MDRVYAPAKTPHSVVDALNAAVVQALAQPGAKAFFAKFCMMIAASSAAELARFNKEQIELWRILVKQAGMRRL